MSVTMEHDSCRNTLSLYKLQLEEDRPNVMLSPSVRPLHEEDLSAKRLLLSSKSSPLGLYDRKDGGCQKINKGDRDRGDLKNKTGAFIKQSIVRKKDQQAVDAVGEAKEIVKQTNDTASARPITDAQAIKLQLSIWFPSLFKPLSLRNLASRIKKNVLETFNSINVTTKNPALTESKRHRQNLRKGRLTHRDQTVKANNQQKADIFSTDAQKKPDRSELKCELASEPDWRHSLTKSCHSFDEKLECGTFTGNMERAAVAQACPSNGNQRGIVPVWFLKFVENNPVLELDPLEYIAISNQNDKMSSVENQSVCKIQLIPLPNVSATTGYEQRLVSIVEQCGTYKERDETAHSIQATKISGSDLKSKPMVMSDNAESAVQNNDSSSMCSFFPRQRVLSFEYEFKRMKPIYQIAKTKANKFKYRKSNKGGARSKDGSKLGLGFKERRGRNDMKKNRQVDEFKEIVQAEEAKRSSYDVFNLLRGSEMYKKDKKQTVILPKKSKRRCGRMKGSLIKGVDKIKTKICQLKKSHQKYQSDSFFEGKQSVRRKNCRKVNILTENFAIPSWTFLNKCNSSLDGTENELEVIDVINRATTENEINFSRIIAPNASNNGTCETIDQGIRRPTPKTFNSSVNITSPRKTSPSKNYSNFSSSRSPNRRPSSRMVNSPVSGAISSDKPNHTPLGTSETLKSYSPTGRKISNPWKDVASFVHEKLVSGKLAPSKKTEDEEQLCSQDKTFLFQSHPRPPPQGTVKDNSKLFPSPRFRTFMHRATFDNCEPVMANTEALMSSVSKWMTEVSQFRTKIELRAKTACTFSPNLERGDTDCKESKKEERLKPSTPHTIGSKTIKTKGMESMNYLNEKKDLMNTSFNHPMADEEPEDEEDGTAEEEEEDGVEEEQGEKNIAENKSELAERERLRIEAIQKEKEAHEDPAKQCMATACPPMPKLICTGIETKNNIGVNFSSRAALEKQIIASDFITTKRCWNTCQNSNQGCSPIATCCPTEGCRVKKAAICSPPKCVKGVIVNEYCPERAEVYNRVESFINNGFPRDRYSSDFLNRLANEISPPCLNPPSPCKRHIPSPTKAYGKIPCCLSPMAKSCRLQLNNSSLDSSCVQGDDTLVDNLQSSSQHTQNCSSNAKEENQRDETVMSAREGNRCNSSCRNEEESEKMSPSQSFHQLNNTTLCEEKGQNECFNNNVVFPEGDQSNNEKSVAEKKCSSPCPAPKPLCCGGPCPKANADPDPSPTKSCCFSSPCPKKSPCCTCPCSPCPDFCSPRYLSKFLNEMTGECETKCCLDPCPMIYTRRKSCTFPDPLPGVAKCCPSPSPKPVCSPTPKPTACPSPCPQPTYPHCPCPSPKPAPCVSPYIPFYCSSPCPPLCPSPCCSPSCCPCPSPSPILCKTSNFAAALSGPNPCFPESFPSLSLLDTTCDETCVYNPYPCPPPLNCTDPCPSTDPCPGYNVKRSPSVCQQPSCPPTSCLPCDSYTCPNPFRPPEQSSNVLCSADICFPQERCPNPFRTVNCYPTECNTLSCCPSQLNPDFSIPLNGCPNPFRSQSHCSNPNRTSPSFNLCRPASCFPVSCTENACNSSNGGQTMNASHCSDSCRPQSCCSERLDSKDQCPNPFRPGSRCPSPHRLTSACSMPGGNSSGSHNFSSSPCRPMSCCVEPCFTSSCCPEQDKEFVGCSEPCRIEGVPMSCYIDQNRPLCLPPASCCPDPKHPSASPTTPHCAPSLKLNPSLVDSSPTLKMKCEYVDNKWKEIKDKVMSYMYQVSLTTDNACRVRASCSELGSNCFETYSNVQCSGPVNSPCCVNCSKCDESGCDLTTTSCHFETSCTPCISTCLYPSPCNPCDVETQRLLDKYTSPRPYCNISNAYEDNILNTCHLRRTSRSCLASSFDEACCYSLPRQCPYKPMTPCVSPSILERCCYSAPKNCIDTGCSLEAERRRSILERYSSDLPQRPFDCRGTKPRLFKSDMGSCCPPVCKFSSTLPCTSPCTSPCKKPPVCKTKSTNVGPSLMESCPCFSLQESLSKEEEGSQGGKGDKGEELCGGEDIKKRCTITPGGRCGPEGRPLDVSCDDSSKITRIARFVKECLDKDICPNGKPRPVVHIRYKSKSKNGSAGPQQLTDELKKQIRDVIRRTKELQRRNNAQGVSPKMRTVVRLKTGRNVKPECEYYKVEVEDNETNGKGRKSNEIGRGERRSSFNNNCNNNNDHDLSDKTIRTVDNIKMLRPRRQACLATSKILTKSKSSLRGAIHGNQWPESHRFGIPPGTRFDSLSHFWSSSYQIGSPRVTGQLKTKTKTKNTKNSFCETHLKTPRDSKYFGNVTDNPRKPVQRLETTARLATITETNEEMPKLLNSTPELASVGVGISRSQILQSERDILSDKSSLVIKSDEICAGTSTSEIDYRPNKTFHIYKGGIINIEPLRKTEIINSNDISPPTTVSENAKTLLRTFSSQLEMNTPVPSAKCNIGKVPETRCHFNLIQLNPSSKYEELQTSNIVDEQFSECSSAGVEDIPFDNNGSPFEAKQVVNSYVQATTRNCDKCCQCSASVHNNVAPLSNQGSADSAVDSCRDMSQFNCQPSGAEQAYPGVPPYTVYDDCRTDTRNTSSNMPSSLHAKKTHQLFGKCNNDQSAMGASLTDTLAAGDTGNETDKLRDELRRETTPSVHVLSKLLVATKPDERSLSPPSKQTNNITSSQAESDQCPGDKNVDTHFSLRVGCAEITKASPERVVLEGAFIENHSDGLGSQNVLPFRLVLHRACAQSQSKPKLRGIFTRRLSCSERFGTWRVHAG